MTKEKLSVLNNTREVLPLIDFLFLKNKILKNKYDLSLVFIGEKTSKKLNNEYRQKNKPTNILSFPLSKDSGEIFLCIKVIKKEASKFNKTYKEFLIFLIVHGMLHLKGYEHGEQMEKEEKKYFSLYKRTH